MKFKITGIAAALGLAAGLGMMMPSAALAADCGTDKKIDIAEMNWPSAAALAQAS